MLRTLAMFARQQRDLEAQDAELIPVIHTFCHLQELSSYANLSPTQQKKQSHGIFVGNESVKACEQWVSK